MLIYENYNWHIGKMICMPKSVASYYACVRGSRISEELMHELIRDDTSIKYRDLLVRDILPFWVPGTLWDIYKGETWLHTSGRIGYSGDLPEWHSMELIDLQTRYESLLTYPEIDMMVSVNSKLSPHVCITLQIKKGRIKVTSGIHAWIMRLLYKLRYPCFNYNTVCYGYLRKYGLTKALNKTLFDKIFRKDGRLRL